MNLSLVDHVVGFQNRDVLSNISVSVAPGEKVAVVGESGAGKSTLLQALYSLSPSTIALCPQSLGLVPTLSVFHNIYMGMLSQRSVMKHLLNLCWPQTSAWNQVKSVANQVGVQDLLRQPIVRLSGGQQQRVALARAMIQGQAKAVSIFVGDEPVSSVDQQHGGLLLEKIKRQFSTVIVALHDRQLALQYFDRIIGIQHGKILFDDKAVVLTMDDLAKVCRDQ